MATPKDLLDYAGERIYRNSLDDVLDQIQQDIENERSIQQARQNIIVNDPDPVKKLREVQSIEKSVVNEPPEVQRAVLDTTYQIPRPVQAPVQPQQNQFMLPPDGTQPTIGQPRGVQQNLSDDDLRFRAELERIQEPFDRIFQEKLKTAKEIPGRNVTDPISGASYTVPGSTKEQIAKQKTIEQLEKDGVIKSQGFRNFLTTAIPLGGLSPEEQAQQTFFPARTALAQLGGAFAGLGVTSQVIKAPKIAQASYDAVRRGTKIGNFLTQKGINTVKAGKFTASATTGAGTFGAFRAIDQIDEDAPIENKAKTIVEDAIFGAGFGLTGSLNNPATRSLAEGTFGFVTSKLMEGATTQEALLNGLLFAGFGVLNKRNMSDVEKGIAINEFKKVGDDSFRIIQDLRKQAGQKPFTKLQEKQWKKARDQFSERFRYEKYSPEQVKADTEEFITRFLQTNDPKGSIARIRQLGNQANTQSLQAKAKVKKEAVSVPTTGKADKVSQENVVKMSLGQQVKELQKLGYTDDQLVRLDNIERADIVANSIKPVNFYKKEQPTRPSMPVPGPAPDVTPSTKKSDKLVPEKLEPKPKEVKPEVKPTKGEAKGLKTVTLKPSDIKIDESKFQPREEYNQAVIDDIAKNFDPKKWDEPVLYQDPKTNEYIVVSGHHRHRGVVKGGYGSATYKVLPKGTTIDDAINMSEEGNLARTEQSSFENSKVVRRRFDKGNSLVDIANALPGLTKATSNAGKSNAVRKLLNLSYLDNKGSLKSNYDSVNEFPKIQSTSSYVGGLRKQYDWMTDKYEDDVFTYLYTENGIRQDDADWKLNIDSTLEKLADMKERPGSILKQLRKDPLQPKEGTPDEVLTQIKDIKKSIDNIGNQLTDDKFLQREIDRIQTEKGLTDVDALQEVKRDLRKRRAELKAELKDLVEESSKPDPDQETMFDDIEQYNMFGGVNILKDVSKKDKLILDDLHNELLSIDREREFLSKQIIDNKINKIKAKKQQQELDKRYEETIKKMQKIDKPVNGATAKPGFDLDFNEQIKLSLQNKKQTELFREKATEEDKQTAKKLKSEVSRLRSRLGVSVRVSNVLEPLEKYGANYFIGQKIGSPEELAVIAQVARDRRFEKFHIFFTKRQPDGRDKVVQYTGMSNRMPGWVNPFRVKKLGIYKDSHLIGHMSKVMAESGADGYYLLHNHPSSAPIASEGDKSATAFTDKQKEGFRGHVIINSQEYGYILPNKFKKGTYTVGVKQLPYESRPIEDPLYDKSFDEIFFDIDDGAKVQKKVLPESIPQMLQGFVNNKNVISIFATNYQLKMNALVDLPVQKFVDAGSKRKFGFGIARIKAQLRKIARDHGGQRLFLVTNRVDEDSYFPIKRVFNKLYREGFITEGIFFDDYNNPTSYENISRRKGTVKGKLVFGKKTKFQFARVLNESNYRGAHTAPSADYGAPGHDLTEMYPDDIYGPNGAIYYGHGGDSRNRKQDNDTIAIIRSLRNNPDKKINIYRAVPKAVKDINPGDWVTINKDYAKEHGERHLDNYTVLSKKVPVKEIYTDGNSIHEWGWNPQTNVSPSQTKSPEFKKWFKGSQVKDKDGNPLVVYHGGYKDINKFNTPSFFSDDSRTAEIFSDDLGNEGEIYPVYLSIKNPYITKDAEMWKKIRDLTQYVNPMQYLKENGIDNPEQYDGLIYESKNGLGNVGVFSNDYSEIIAFNPNQIKSAIGNRGTFDPDSPSIIEDDIPAIKIKPHKQLQKEAPKVPKKIYDDARNKVEGKSRLKAIVSLSKTIKKEFKEPGTLNRILTPFSTRLRVLAPELKRAIRRFEFNVAINTAKDLQVAENFMKQTDKLRKKNIGDYTVLDLAMKNSDLKTAQDILDKHDMGSEFIKVRNMLDNIYARAEMVGYEPNYLSDYFPRKIKDSDGLMNYLYESDSWGVLQSNIKEKEKELGRRLEKDERLKLINNLIRGFGGRLGIQRPANLKEREIEYLNTDLNEFYYDSNTALHRYIVQMNEAIEIKRFFGKGMGPEDPNVQVDNNVVGEYVDNLLDQGVIKPNQQDELINLLRIRFAQGPMDPRIAKMRSGSYLLTMGQLSSAVTQIGDLAWSIYSGGLTQTGKALGKSVVRKSAITKKDIGIDKIAQEFTEVPGASKILDRVFTLSGLNYIDSLGKEALINSTIGRYQKQAKKGKFSSSLQERLDEAFSEKELPKVIEDLKSGNITDDIKYLAHYTLSDFQPVSLSEMPEYYLKSPNGRIMYMLKSYQIKQFNVIRDEAFKKMNQGKTAKEKTEGVRRLIYLASVLMLTGMTADKIKNFMYGREQELDEMVTDNLLRLFGFNKYLVYVQKRYKNWAYTALKFMAPPVFLLNPLFESAMQDLDKFYRTKKKGEKYKIPEDVKTVKNLPLIGKFYYEYFGPGKEYNMKRKEEKQKKGKKKKRKFYGRE